MTIYCGETTFQQRKYLFELLSCCEISVRHVAGYRSRVTYYRGNPDTRGMA